MTTMASGRWSFLLPIAIFTLACAAALVAILYFAQVPIVTGHVVMLGYFAVLTAVLHTWQERALITDPKGFVNRFMGGLVIKMLLTLMVLLLGVVLLPRPSILHLALPFIGLYLAYMVFSTARLTGQLRKVGRT
jgi:hypothetical protein